MCTLAAHARSPDELVVQMQATVSMYQDDTAIREELIAAGDEALPAVAEGLRAAYRRLDVEPRMLDSWNEVTAGIRPSPDMLLANHLLRCAAGIGTDDAIALLVSTIADASDPWVKWSAVSWLEKRTIRVPLPVEAKSGILRFIAECDAQSAGTAAMVLANCVAVAASERVPPIVTRFEIEVQAEPEPGERAMDSYVSPRVLRLNPFLRAFRDAGEAAIPYLRVESDAHANDPEMRKWLTIAQGMAGDGDVAADLERIIREDPDTSTRVEATSAYARSAKEAAIPLLVELLDDPAQITDRFALLDGRVLQGTLDGFRPVAGTAMGELSRLDRQDLIERHRRLVGSQAGEAASSK
jgi:hypothetical protein